MLICLLRTTAEGVDIKNNLKYVENIGLTKKHPKSGTKSSTITNVSYSTQIPTSSNPSDITGKVKVSQHIDAEKCD